MCTLVFAWQVFDGAPIAVAANRDERLDRPASPPAVYATDPVVIAPRDAQAGGTWIGVNEAGLFTGITNRWLDDDLPSERSRGKLVADVLSCSSATKARAHVERALENHAYDGFNLVIADDGAAWCLEWDGESSWTAFDPGVHIVYNTGFDDVAEIPTRRGAVASDQATNAQRVKQRLEEALEDQQSSSGDVSVPACSSDTPDSDAPACSSAMPYSDAPVDSGAVSDWLETAGNVLGDHEYGVCVHGDGFGTRSSSRLALGGVAQTQYAVTDGPPCRNQYRDVDLGDEFRDRVARVLADEGHI
ncbi:NRDE family protein [Halobacteria archaeon AArc-curdl1]|uniref:NRDE family protein n=1 Tax=Natronosalvus hydrolyticus TaxID=2979988 RepID=A0AAP3E7A7_9EURY|nr:NRDE family protein [Halobacteria archaeon AArc-curdl1]